MRRCAVRALLCLPSGETVSRSGHGHETGFGTAGFGSDLGEPESGDREGREPTGHGMDVLDHATQIPDTATFWKRCGAATTERG